MVRFLSYARLESAGFNQPDLVKKTKELHLMIILSIFKNRVFAIISMNRIRIQPFLFLVFLCGLMSSCLEDIDQNTGERVLNVYCILKQEAEQVLELSYIAPTGGESRPVGDGVTITLYDGDAPVGQFNRTSETKWNLNYTPQGGHSYLLEVKAPGEETVTAKTRYPSPGSLLPVLGVDIEKAAQYTNDPDFLQSGFLGLELESLEDQFLWCYSESQREGSAITGYIASDHPGVDRRGETIYPFDATSPIYKQKFESVTTILHHTRSSGGFLSSYFDEEPPFLHEKVLRILHPAGFCRPIDNEKLRVYHFGSNGYHLVEDESGKTGMFCFGFIDATGTLVINSVSAEYDNYLSDFYFVNHDSDDFTALVYRRNHYSNILNGTGIFGASYEYQTNPMAVFNL